MEAIWLWFRKYREVGENNATKKKERTTKEK